jgi:hypothetical protein
MKNQLQTFQTFREEQELPRIYCDMDGVIADFLKGSKEILGQDFNDDLWDKLPLDLYANLPKMSDADKLWKFISKYDLYILTAFPSTKRGKISKTSQGDKVKWMKKTFNFPSNKVHLVLRAEKQDFAKKGTLLIDDMMKNVKEFSAKGGVGIHHTSAVSTIKQLKELGFK